MAVSFSYDKPEWWMPRSYIRGFAIVGVPDIISITAGGIFLHRAFLDVAFDLPFAYDFYPASSNGYKLGTLFDQPAATCTVGGFPSGGGVLVSRSRSLNHRQWFIKVQAFVDAAPITYIDLPLMPAGYWLPDQGAFLDLVQGFALAESESEHQSHHKVLQHPPALLRYHRPYLTSFEGDDGRKRTMRDVLPHILSIGDSISSVATFILTSTSSGTRVDTYLVDEDAYTLAIAGDLLCVAASILAPPQRQVVLDLLEEISLTFQRLEDNNES